MTATKEPAVDYDIVIVGGGMVGSWLACALVELSSTVETLRAQPLRIAVIESAEPRAPASDENFQMRVSALNQSSLSALEQCGAKALIDASGRACYYRSMQVRDGEGSGQITFSAEEMQQTHLGAIVENAQIQAALWQRVCAFSQGVQKNVQIYCPSRVQDMQRDAGSGRWLVHLAGGECLRARLLVGADGAQSYVREATGFVLQQTPYGHDALVCTVQTQYAHGLCARQVFTREGPLAFLPLAGADQRHCSIVWSAVPAFIDRLQAMSATQRAACLQAGIENVLGDVSIVGPCARFPLIARDVPQSARDGVVLIGDAAHTIHPLAGQGVNLGLADAVALCGELQRALLRGLDIADPEVLARYQLGRRESVQRMLVAMRGFRELFGHQPLPLRWLRGAGMQLVDHTPMVKRLVMQVAAGAL